MRQHDASDVTAVVLTIGEASTERAIASVRHQSLPVAEIVVVEGISPAYRAINAGAARVRTEFFVQVDADMILDATCLADLRRCMSAGLGIVLGHLRDPLLGRILGVKLFRTRCFERVQYRDSISASSDFSHDIARHGWMTIHALRHGPPDDRHTFGAHRPDYTPDYTFSKFWIEGAVSRYRRAEGRFKRLFRQLRASTHRAAPIATLALAHGLFLTEEHNLKVPLQRNPESEFLKRFLSAPDGTREADAAEAALAPGTLAERFIRAYELGCFLRQRGAASTFLDTLQQLRMQDDRTSCVALIGVCHGLFNPVYRPLDATEAFAALQELLSGAEPW